MDERHRGTCSCEREKQKWETSDENQSVDDAKQEESSSSQRAGLDVIGSCTGELNELQVGDLLGRGPNSQKDRRKKSVRWSFSQRKGWKDKLGKEGRRWGARRIRASFEGLKELLRPSALG